MSFGSDHQSTNRRRSHNSRTRLVVEQLEPREVPATLLPSSDFTTPAGKSLYVPLSVTAVNGTVNYSAASSNSQVQVQVVAGGTTLKMTVAGTGADGNPFQGDLTFRLFDDLSPVTVARIVDLVNQGFYNGLTFHRILDGFVAQGGDPDGNGTGGSGQTLDDEFSSLLTFNSPGLLAMANSGDDTGDSQFFITDIDLTLAQQPQHLNFDHTIFGQLVAGFDTFNRLMRTPVNNPAVGTPVNDVTILNASVAASDPNGVLRISAPQNFRGNSTITVTPTDSGGAGPIDSFQVNFVADTVNDRPFLGPIPNRTTTPGTGVTVPLTATDLDNDPLTFQVLSTTSAGETINALTRIDQTTGHLTIIPPAGFFGPIDVLIAVRDASGQTDTQTMVLAVTGNFDLEADSDTGALADDNITGDSSPTFLVLAPTGQTVNVTVNGTAAGTATETSTAGQYRITVPQQLLQAGENSIAGTASSGSNSIPLSPLSFSYNPNLRSVYIVPGTLGTDQSLTFEVTSIEAAHRSELGYYIADDATGALNGLRPGDAGYFAAAMARREIVFTPAAVAGTARTITAEGGEALVFYLVQDATSVELLAENPTNSLNNGPVAFFGLRAANPDGVAHLAMNADLVANQTHYGWEDLIGGGDQDYNDLVFSVRSVASGTIIPTLPVPAGQGRAVTATAQLQTATKSASNNNPTTSTTTNGQIGVIVADSASGAIGSLQPGTAGYAEAALGRAQPLFAAGTSAGTNASVKLLGGQSLIFYYVPNGTAAAVLATNPTNNPASGTTAFFSIAAANENGTTHARYFNPEGVSGATPTVNTPLTVHMSGVAGARPNDFDDVVFTVQFVS